MFTLTKKERLCSKETIERLYSSPHKTLVFPLSVHWLETDYTKQPSRLQVLIVAPKKKLHHAVDRNRTKRLMRECYRKRKGLLLESLEGKDKAYALSINYIDDKVPDFHRLELSFDKLFETLKEKMAND